MIDKELLIVIPAYNEEKNISEVLINLKKVLPDVDVVVINDGSKDKTADLARGLCTEVISRPVNLGDGAARQTGFKYALKKQYQYLIHLDADGQHNPLDIPKIFNELKKGDFDVIIGSRVLENKLSAMPFLKKWGMKICSFIVLIITRKIITDTTSGFRGLNRKAMEFYVNQFYPQHFPDTDVIIASFFAGLKIKEIPVKMAKRVYGRPLHSGLSSIYYIYKTAISIFKIIFKKYRSIKSYD